MISVKFKTCSLAKYFLKKHFTVVHPGCSPSIFLFFVFQSHFYYFILFIYYFLLFSKNMKQVDVREPKKSLHNIDRKLLIDRFIN